MSGYMYLACAVVKQAAKEYKSLLVKSKKRKSNDDTCPSIDSDIKELEDFFLDEDNLLLMGADGSVILSEIRKNVDNGE